MGEMTRKTAPVMPSGPRMVEKKRKENLAQGQRFFFFGVGGLDIYDEGNINLKGREKLFMGILGSLFC